MRWGWETKDSIWHVTLDGETRTLYWHGEDKPRPGVSGRDLAGGGVRQTIDDLLATGRSGYPCPPGILGEVIAAAHALAAAGNETPS